MLQGSSPNASDLVIIVPSLLNFYTRDIFLSTSNGIQSLRFSASQIYFWLNAIKISDPTSLLFSGGPSFRLPFLHVSYPGTSSRFLSVRVIFQIANDIYLQNLISDVEFLGTLALERQSSVIKNVDNDGCKIPA